jgi:hypothetical protein
MSEKSISLSGSLASRRKCSSCFGVSGLLPVFLIIRSPPLDKFHKKRIVKDLLTGLKVNAMFASVPRILGFVPLINGHLLYLQLSTYRGAVSRSELVLRRGGSRSCRASSVTRSTTSGAHYRSKESVFLVGVAGDRLKLAVRVGPREGPNQRLKAPCPV